MGSRSLKLYLFCSFLEGINIFGKEQGKPTETIPNISQQWYKSVKTKSVVPDDSGVIIK